MSRLSRRFVVAHFEACQYRIALAFTQNREWRIPVGEFPDPFQVYLHVCWERLHCPLQGRIGSDEFYADTSVPIYNRENEGEVIQRNDVVERADQASHFDLPVHVTDVPLAIREIVLNYFGHFVKLGPDFDGIALDGKDRR